MGIIYWLKKKNTVKRIVRTPLLSKIREQVDAVYGRYVFFLSKIGKEEPMNTGQRCPILLVTIAFNHEGLIKKQIEMIRRHVHNAAFQHIIIDNSSVNAKRKAIKTVCNDMGVEYISVPRRITLLTLNTLFYPSYSHGAALNWAYHHIIRSRRPESFVFFDHDIIPIKPYDFIAALGTQDFYGVERMRRYGWYLWAGWCVFRLDSIIDKRVDFSPTYIKHSYLDTGGHNFLTIFCHYNHSDLRFASSETHRIRTTPKLRTHNDIYHSDCIQLIDKAWIHIVNGSNYAHIKGKEEMVSLMLEKIQ